MKAQSSLCLHLLAHLRQHKIVSLPKVLSFYSENFVDPLSVLELIYLFSGLGLATLISKKQLIYTGMKGVQCVAEAWKSYESVGEIAKEELCILNQTFSLQPLLVTAQLASEVIGLMLASSDKCLKMQESELVVERYLKQYKEYKEVKIRALFDQIQSVLHVLRLAQFSQDTKSLQWLQPPSFTQEFYPDEATFIRHLTEAPIQNYIQDKNQDKNQINNQVNNYVNNQVNNQENIQENKQEIDTNNQEEITKKIKLEDDIEIKIITEQEPKTPITIPKSNLPPKIPLSSFPQCGFAMLKGKQTRYFMKKLQVILGQTPQQNNGKETLHCKWHVDFNVASTKNVSKQHAAILFNFEEGDFEIVCLSKKFPLMVNKKIIHNWDQPQKLPHKSVINIGNDQITFYLPRGETQD